MGRTASLNKGVGRMIAQISKPHAHVMMHRIRHRDGHAETEDAMRQPESIQIAIAKKEWAGDKCPQQREPDQNRIGDVRNGKQQGRSSNRQ
jgi:hypothetical protein